MGNGLGAIAGCHCSVLVVPVQHAHCSVLRTVKTNFEGVDMVRLLGAVAVVPLQVPILLCYNCGNGDDQLWGSGHRAIAGCAHCDTTLLETSLLDTTLLESTLLDITPLESTLKKKTY